MIQKAIFLVGTTASGKSDWALSMAEEVSGVILNCDSIQMYDHLKIGSAQPTAEEKSKAPHHLFATVQPPQEVTAGQYRRNHLEILKSLTTPAFVVGGTGFYFQALEKGMFAAPAADEKIQETIEEELREPGGEDILWNELNKMDPVSAAKIHKNDHYRLVRAVEVIRREGRPLSEIKKEFEAQSEPYPWFYLKIGVRWSKEQLELRVKLRTEKMLELGLVDEVKRLLSQGLESWAPLQSVGYKEVLMMLKENKNEAWLKEEIIKNTMRLAKKQRTWFQRDPDILWLEGASDFKIFKARTLNFLSGPGAP